MANIHAMNIVNFIRYDNSQLSHMQTLQAKAISVWNFKQPLLRNWPKLICIKLKNRQDQNIISATAKIIK